MAFWDVTNPKKPKGIKDPNAVLDYPIGYVGWLLDIADSIQSFTVLTTGGLVWDEIKSTELNGIITVWLSAGDAGVAATFTVRVTTVGGRVDDRTFILKIVER